MANLVIEEVAGKNYVKAIFNDYASISGYDYKLFWADDIADVEIDSNNGSVIIELKYEGRVWSLSYTACDKCLIVDSVLGVTPTDNNHLATLIANLKG